MSEQSRNPKTVALVPAWNAQDFIEDTLRSLSAQTCQNFEVIVSIDQSTDQTAAICRRFSESDNRFFIIEQTRRLGWIGNANALLNAGAGDYFLFAYHDDILDPRHVETLVELLEVHPEAVIAYSDLRAHYTNGEVVERVYPLMDGLKSPAQRALNIIQRKGFWSTPNHGVFRASAARRIGGQRRHRAGEFSADWPWLLQLALYGEFVRAPEFLCDKFYKKHSLSHCWRRDMGEILGVSEDCARVIMSSSLAMTSKLRMLAAISVSVAKEAVQNCAPKS